MITILRRKLIAPAANDTIVREHGKAMPIKHYRLGTDCDCSTTAQGPFRDSDSCVATYNPELSALKKVRNSGGNNKQTISNSEYLKRRSKTYEQQSQHYVRSVEDTANNLYNARGTGQLNADDISGCPAPTTWKPSNKYFNQDGGVSNSAYINKVKYNNIQSHGKSMATFDKSIATAYAYSGRADAPFTSKSKMQVAMPGMFRRNGNPQSCDKCIT